MAPKVGDRISQYQIVGVAGSGGMGTVYKALDTRLNRLVALKFPRSVLGDRMMREARLIASLSHRSVCQLLDIGDIDGTSFLVLEYVEGETLDVRLKRGVLPLPEALDFAKAILNGVAAIHGCGLAHGDLKPANLMLAADGPRILDFGLAGLLHSGGRIEEPGQPELWGTPGYMAPELLTGALPTVASDLFALGAIFYEAISSTPAFPGSSALARFASTAQDSPPALTGSRDLVAVDRVLRRAMAKTPNARYASASEFAGELTCAATTRASVGGRSTAATILVLPFRPAHAQPDAEFLAEALPDAIASALASVRSLNVCPSTVAKRYPLAPLDWKAVAAETSADIVVTGAVAVAGAEVSLSVELVRVPEGAIAGGAAHRGSSRDLFALQSAAVRDIVQVLERGFGTLSSPREETHPRSDSYDLYLRANLAAQEPRRIPEACELYRQFLALDPGYALAWARLGRCHRLLAKYHGQPSRNMMMGREALERALSLDPDLYLAHSFYAQHEADEGRTIDALIRLLRLCKAAPNSAEVRAGLTYVCRLCGLYAQSIQFHKAARRIDPSIVTSVTHTYFQSGQYVQCLETYSGQGIGYIEPLALDGLGLHDEAISRVTENLVRSKALGIGTLYVRSLHALWSGDIAVASRDIETAEQNYFLGPEEHYYFARQRILGNIERGLEQLAKAVDRGFYGHRALLCDPWLTSIRSKDAFQRILQACESGHSRALDAYNKGADGLQN